MSLRRIPAVGMKHGAGNVVRALFCSLFGKSQLKPELFHSVPAFDFCSGKAALVVALKALASVQSGKNQVVVPAYTCYSVAAAVEAAGLKMVLVDIDPKSLDFKFDQLKSVVNESTLCIISTHYFGKSADIVQAKTVADSVGAFLIEDAAQSGGIQEAEASISDAIVYSFGRGKPISASGGGILVINRHDVVSGVEAIYEGLASPGLVQNIKSALMMVISDVLINPSVFWLPARFPFLGIGETIYPAHIDLKKMGALKLCLLKRLSSRASTLIGVRKDNARFYFGQLSRFFRDSLSEYFVKSEFSLIRFPVLLNEPPNLLEKKECYSGAELGVSAMYPNGLHKLNEVRDFCVNCHGDFPGADFIASHLITLPTHMLVNREVRDQVVTWVEAQK